MMAQGWFDLYHFMIFLLMVTTTKCKVCTTLNNTDAVLKSVATLTCPLSHWPEGTEVTWEVLQGETAEKVNFATNCSTSCTREAKNNKDQQPLCRMRAVRDLQKGTASLIISPVEVTDGLWYRCTDSKRLHCFEQKITIKDEPQLPTNECNIITPTKVMLNSPLMLQCGPVALTPPLIWGIIFGDVSVPVTRCTSHCTSSRSQKPLCERAKTMKNGSLSISPVESTDLLWFWCALATNLTSCYKFKLTDASPNRITEATTQSPQEQTHGSNGTVVSSNATAITLASSTSIFLFVAILVGVFICFRKQKKKQTVNIDNPYEDIDEIVPNAAAGYSLAMFEQASLQTFKDIEEDIYYSEDTY